MPSTARVQLSGLRSSLTSWHKRSIWHANGHAIPCKEPQPARNSTVAAAGVLGNSEPAAFHSTTSG